MSSLNVTSGNHSREVSFNQVKANSVFVVERSCVAPVGRERPLGQSGEVRTAPGRRGLEEAAAGEGADSEQVEDPQKERHGECSFHKQRWHRSR